MEVINRIKKALNLSATQEKEPLRGAILINGIWHYNERRYNELSQLEKLELDLFFSYIKKKQALTECYGVGLANN